MASVTLRRRSPLIFPGVLLAAMLLAAGGTFGVLSLLSAAEPDGEPLTTGAIVDPSAAGASFTYSFKLSQLLAARCGEVETASLGAASADETSGSDALAAQAAVEAEKRAGTIGAASCNRILVEIQDANKRAQRAGY